MYVPLLPRIFLVVIKLKSAMHTRLGLTSSFIASNMLRSIDDHLLLILLQVYMCVCMYMYVRMCIYIYQRDFYGIMYTKLRYAHLL
jgi:hypothetical protein